MTSHPIPDAALDDRLGARELIEAAHGLVRASGRLFDA